MRGRVDTQSSLFAYVDLESKLPSAHSLRRIKKMDMVKFEPDELDEEGRKSLTP